MTINDESIQAPDERPPKQPQFQFPALIQRIQERHLQEYQQPVAVMWRQDIQQVYFFHCPNRVPHFEWWLPEFCLSQTMMPGTLNIEAIFEDPQLNQIYAQIQRKASLDTLSGEFHSLQLQHVIRENDLCNGLKHQPVVKSEIFSQVAPESFPLSQMVRSHNAFHLTRNALVKYVQELHLREYGEPVAVLIKTSERGSLSHRYIPNRFPRCEWQISWDLAERMLWDPEYQERFIFSACKQIGMHAQKYTHHREKALPNALYGGGGYTLFDPPPRVLSHPFEPHYPE